MDNFMVRMGVVIGALVAVQVGFVYVGHMSHPTVLDPSRPIEDFPLAVSLPETGAWEGKNVKLDDRSFNEAEVSSAVSRVYTKENRAIKFLLGVYKDPSRGLYHNPMNCYHSQGFTLMGDAERLPLAAANRPDTELSVSTWTRNSEKVVVAYWYEVGDNTVFERHDLLDLQWAMRGKAHWPPMFKVLLESPASDTEQAKAELLDMARFVRQWLGEAQAAAN